MEKFSERTSMIFGEENIEKLSKSTVTIFGIGGVGSFVAESLVRTGVGKFILVDFDVIALSNINRQIHSNVETIGKYKVEEMAKRMKLINPNIEVIPLKEKYTSENSEMFFNYDTNYIIDCIDMVSSKIDLIVKAKEKNIPIISAMGAGNKIEPTKLQIGDIYETEMCPLARVMRRELKRRNVKNLKVVYSKEKAIELKKKVINPESNKVTPGSVIYLPAVAGMIMASEVVNDILK